MHLLLGNSRMESGDYEGAIKSFECAIQSSERARTKLRPDANQALSVVSLVSCLMVILQRIETDRHV